MTLEKVEAKDRLGQGGQAAHDEASHSLVRALSGFANWAMTYSAVGVSAGLFSLFGFSLASVGPSLFWGWVIVGIGTLLVATVMAELASHYPYAGVMYRWPSMLAGRHVGWWIGWLYLFAIMAVTAAYYFIVPPLLIALFGWEDSSGLRVLIAAVALAIATISNVAGVRVLGRFTEWAAVADLIALVIFALLVMIFGATHDPSIVFSDGGTLSGSETWLPALLAGGVFVSVWTQYGYEHGGTLAEETIDAERQAPKGILYAWLAVFLLGFFWLLAFLMATPDFGEAIASGTPVQDIITGALGSGWADAYLILVVFVAFIGSNVFFTAAARQVFGMARDGMLPFSKQLLRTNRRTGSPYLAIVVVALITAIPFAFSSDFAVLVTGATASAYVCYFAVMCIALRARLRGWPRDPRPFRLGRWGVPINIAAVLFTGALLLNLEWFRDATNPPFKLGIPGAVWMTGLPLILGIVFYFGVARKRLQRDAP